MGYELVDKQVIFEGRVIRTEVHRLRDTATQKTTAREVIVHPGAVVVLAFASETEILLIRNKRYAVGQSLIELPAGTLEKGEAPMNCAGRELLEETGYLAHRIKPIGSFYTSPGILSEKIFAFAAYDLEKKETKFDDGEEIELLPTPLADAIEMIRSGEIADAKTIATILMFKQSAGAPAVEG